MRTITFVSAHSDAKIVFTTASIVAFRANPRNPQMTDIYTGGTCFTVAETFEQVQEAIEASLVKVELEKTKNH